ncbi:SdrD B-like domain-containing protein [Piscinibacter sp.]|uniref:SdrD B-like domain-containing protein n=1 Tax=Piscinibacter sp. TaxID=1903157 RepID=UPI0039E68FCD
MSRLLRSALGRLLFALGPLLVAAQAHAADPLISSFTDNPDPVPAGGNVTYTAVVSNQMPDAATNVVLTVPVPAGATFVSAAAPCALSGGSVVCNLGSVAGSDTDVRTLNMVFRANGPGPGTITATATLASSNDTNPNTSNNVQSQSTSVSQGGDLSLAMTGTPNPVVGGANVTYTLTPSNAGPNDSGPITITDTLPPSAVYQSYSGSGWNCGVSGQVVTCTHAGNHPAGTPIAPLSIVARINAASGNVTNTATVAPSAGGTADPNPANNGATVTTAVQPGADVRINAKTITSATPVIAGTNVTFQIQPRNSGPAAATNAVVTDTLPAGFTFVSASTGSPWNCTNAGQTVTCTRANFPVGATENISVVATAPGNAVVGPTGSSYTNTASINSAVADPNGGNNAGSVNFTVRPDGADLSITKAKWPNPVAQGSNLTSAIEVTNNGPRTATGPLRVVELLNGETFVSASGTGWSCALAPASTTTLVCNHPNASGLAVNASLPTLTIVTTATSSGTLTNQACTGSTVPAGAAGGVTASPPTQGDPNTANDCDSAGSNSTTVRPDLAISKATSTPTGGDKIVSTSESSVTYTLNVGNVSATAQDATGVRIVDEVPGFITGRTTFGTITATPSGGSTATFSCGNSGATVTCTQTGGVLAQGQSVAVVITVNRPLNDGNFTNTATVSNTAEGDPVDGNNSATDEVTIQPIADVEMTGKTASPGTVLAGVQSTYVLSYRNNGPSQAANVTVTDAFAFPAGDTGLTVVSIAATGGATCSIAAGAVLDPANSSFTCTKGNMNNGETQTVTLVVRPNYQPGNPGGRSFGNTATVATTSVESPSGGDNGNNSETAALTVNAASVDLLVNKTDVVDPVAFQTNGFLDYVVTVTSQGPSYATGVRITETMTPPAGKRVRFVCDTTGPGSSTCNPTTLCSVGNVTSAPGTALPDFTCDVPAGNATTGAARGTLAAGQSKTLWLRFEALDAPASNGDLFVNRAVSSSTEPDPLGSNNTATEQTNVRQRIELAVTKTASLASVTIGQPFDWTVTVTNNGNGNSLQTDLTDTLPAGVAVSGAITWSKTLPAGNGTCTLTGSTINCPLGQLDNTGVATITVPARVTAYPTGGSLTNTATVDTTPSKIGGVDPVPGNNSANSTVTVTRSTLSGTVFEDRDRSGANAGTPQAPGVEPRIAGVTITLTGTDTYGNPVSRTTTTDANGNYSFNDLPPSDATGYTITETQPAGYRNSPDAPPTAGAQAPSLGGGYAAGGSTGNSSYTGVVVGAAATAERYNFPELPAASISGRVVADADNDGVVDPGEGGIANVSIVLTGTDTDGNPVNITTTTDADGRYTFPDLRPGTYTVTEPTQPPDTVDGITRPGTINGTPTGTATTPAQTPSAISNIVITSGSTSIDNNFFEVGNSPDLLVSKAATETRFTVGNLGHYTLRVRNIGQAPTVGAYTVRDRLPAGLQLAAVPSGTGWSCTGAVGTQIVTCESSDVIAGGATSPNAISVIVTVLPAALQASPLTNVALVEGGGELPARGPTPAETDAFNNNPGSLPACDPAITANACRVTTPVQASASISGTTWYDIGSSSHLLDGGDRRLAGWTVEVLDAAGNIVGQATTQADGSYRVDGLVPGEALRVRFRDPSSNTVWAYPVNGESAPGSSGAACNTAAAIANGTASSCPGTGGDPTLTVVLAPGQNLPQQSLPVDPSGVVYDAGNRQPVPGSVVTLQPVGACAGWDPATGLVGATLGGYTVNGGAVSMTVGSEGFYQFLFTPAAPASCTFALAVTPPSSHSFVSTQIPPTDGTYTPGGAPGTTVQVQPNGNAPTGPAGPATTYYLQITAGSGTPNIVHNHIPLDPVAPTGLTLSKTGDRQIVEVGDSVRYTITVQRTSGPVPRQVTVVDRLPAGFTFIAGTATVNGVSVADPAGKPGPALVFNLGEMPASNQLVLQYRVRVGVGAMQGDGTNRAIGYACQQTAGCTNGSSPLPGSNATNEGRHTVRVTGGVFTTDACVLGKIFIDCNNNHVQDPEEIGIPGVRFVISDGTVLVSDSEGKYSYCGLPPRSHVMRVDETTLPPRSRLTTSSNRNLGDAGSLWLDLKNGELHRADFVEGSCNATVLDQTKARRAQGEIRSVDTEQSKPPALRFDSINRDKGPWPRTQTPAPRQEGGAR